MHPPDVLLELVIVMGVSIAAVYALKPLKIPAIVGFLLAGVLIGPGGLALVRDRHDIELLAEVGVVFLLFSIGLKFSLGELLRMKALVLGVGGLQVGVTVGLALGLGRLLGLEAAQAAFLGMLLAMSSTAIVLTVLEERGETSSLHGRVIIAVLIFQDLAVVPFMLLVPLLGGQGATAGQMATTLLRSVGVILGILAAARWVFPWVIERVVRTRSREAFALLTFGVALGTAYAAGLAGMSLALGAFLAGLVISESDYSTQIVTEIAPIRDALSSLFFVSVGMLVDVGAFLERPHVSVGLVLAVMLAKWLVVAAVALGFGFGPRIATLVGLGLAQIGEFSFILAQAGAGLGLLEPAAYQQFLGVSVVTMALTPFGLMASHWLAGRTQGVSWLASTLRGAPSADGAGEGGAGGHGGGHGHGGGLDLADHVVVVGFGVNGRNVARVLRQLDVPVAVLELNPFTVRKLREEEGLEAVYGDSTRGPVLEAVGVPRARVLVVAVSDPVSARETVAVARKLAPELVILVRTRYLAEVPHLYKLGATEVAVEEFETSLELATLVMLAFGAPERVVAREREAIRAERHEALRAGDAGRPLRRRTSLATLAQAADFDELELTSDAPGVGRTLGELRLRERAGASVVAVTRGGKVEGNPGAGFRLEAGDLLVAFGTPEQLEGARRVLLPQRGPATTRYVIPSEARRRLIEEAAEAAEASPATPAGGAPGEDPAAGRPV